ncbi:hypothetical protein DICPUDRAFT_151990 [Dictyostelium purpureum]|uniref:Dickkopf N-terminal cysteine-rich domain-containing protein n=1 Tax=Dictyostelium purpureum TaxID=5786 RepID=F0ZK77_DICPU|nr:uncharacterized protein DICPUDRAFT_151990 [Dictyostelium purpureum]EGC35652.1 hypothetical protein DICPUDRAFT_151990 [Dictyostelium purpureum]|eukprot:XP_003287831.1 hypothetical protein DICPUDRAFT_151990 [Dictyostelium purpureum]
MKFFYSLILILLTFNYINANCDCIPIGEPCEKNGESCQNFGYCGTPGTETSNNQSICVNRVNVGEPCFVNDSCYIGLYCYKKNSNDTKGVCSEIKYALNGEKCAKDIDCMSELSSCVNNKCTLRKNVNGCEDDMDCELASQICVNKICQLPAKLGSACTKRGDTCNRLEGFCASPDGGNDGICKKHFSLQEGEYCYFDYDYKEYQCDSSKNLYCNNINKKCQVYSYIKPNIESCDGLYQCNAHLNGTTAESICACGKCYEIQLVSSYDRKVITDLFTCALTNECSFSIPFTSKGCLATKCFKEYCAYYLIRSKFDSCGGLAAHLSHLKCDVNNSFKLLPSLSFLILLFIYLLF